MNESMKMSRQLHNVGQKNWFEVIFSMGGNDEIQDTRTGEDEGFQLKYVRRGTRSSIC